MLKHIFSLLVFSLIVFSCSNKKEEKQDYKINSLFADGDTIVVTGNAMPSGQWYLELYNSKGDTVILSSREELRTYTVTVTDTLIKPKKTTVPPPVIVTPPTTAERKNIVFEDMFEATNPGSKYAAQRQWCCDYSVTSSDKIFFEGKRSVRMEHKGTENVSSGYRVEFQSDQYFKPATEAWYGYAMYFENFKAQSPNYHFPQWHPQGSGSANLGIYGGSGTFHVRLNPEGDESAFTLKDGKKIENGKWYTFVWHIKWAATGGIIELYINGEKYVDFKGATLTRGGTPYFKLGLNRFDKSNTNMTFYVDALRIGNNLATYSDVAP